MEVKETEFKKINKKFYRLNILQNKNFECINGKEKIIISSPHSVSQFRNGKIKKAEPYTGAIAILLQRQLDCYCIYKTKNNNDDANYDIENNNYKNTLKEIIKTNNIKFLLDIHGAKDEYGFDIDIGTDELKNLNGHTEILDEFLILSKEFNFKTTVDKFFKANSLHTIAYTISNELNIPCMQIEIAKKYRDINQFENIRRLLNFLEKFLNNIINSNKLGRKR